MTANRPTVSVIVPTLNEAENLPLVFPFLPRDWIDEVILVDGSSTDGTVDIARRLVPDLKVVLQPLRGKGAALQAGYDAACGEVVIVLDADGSNDPREIPRFVQALMEGSDFVKGSRFAPRGGTTDMPRYRKLGNSAFVHLVNLLFDQCFTDLCYGYHAFWRYCLAQLDLGDIDGFEIDTAIYLRAVQQRLRVTEVPSFEGYRFYGVGKLQTIPDGWRVLKTIFREWWRSLRGPSPVLHMGFRGLVPAADALALGAGGPPGVPSIAAPAAPASRPLFPPAERARLYMQMLYTVGRVLKVETDLADLLREVLQLTLESVGAASGSIVMLDEHGHARDGCLLYSGQVRALPSAAVSDVVERGLARWVLDHRQPALVPNTRDDPRWLRRGWEDQEGQERSALGVPLMIDQRVIGVLTLVRAARPFTEQELDLLAGMVTPTW